MSAPLVVTTRAELAETLAGARRSGRRVALVPTMGALHDGHASLMSTARECAGDGPVVVSIFVNPLQFGEAEDLARYPRTLEADLLVCEKEDVDVVFAPAVGEVYPGGPPQITLDPGPIGAVLEGRTRPGHFAGMLSVVTKLLGLVRPDVAVFGHKDYQQLVLIRRLVADLCLGVEIHGAPTRREPDGLALSSRNVFLDPEQRRHAVVLSRALIAADHAAHGGLRAALDAARAELRTTDGVDLDYLEITGPDLTALPDDVAVGAPAVILIAARVGGVRLIDNLPLVLGQRSDQVSSPAASPASPTAPAAQPTATTPTGK